MKKYSAETHNILGQILDLSPKQKQIAIKFFMWRTKQKSIYPSHKYIAKGICSEDTVIRFLKQNSNLILSRRQRGRTSNIYIVQERFFRAMEILDRACVLNKGLKAQKRWLMNLQRRELDSVYEMDAFCDPSGPNLRHYSVFDPNTFLRSSSTQSGVTAQRGLFLKTSELLKSIDAPEGAIRFIQHDIAMTLKALKANVTWYESQHEIKNREAFTISAYQHVKARDTFTRLRSQRREGRQIKPSYRY
ncbi:MAG: hypothetical protein JSR39_11120 [Verrucomicrobia bacterium]|nr:hypothetical protein [Verrucomicrobiota bacterium]